MLVMEVILVNFVIDAARRDPKQSGHVRLIAVSLVECGFEEQPFAILEGACEVPIVTVQEVHHRGEQLLR